MNIDIQKIFIVHCKKLVERKPFIIQQIIKSGLNINEVEWVTHFDKDEWDLNEIKKLYPRLFDKSGIHCKMIDSPLCLSDVSLDLKHHFIIDTIVKNKIKDALIFEDDCIIQDNFIENFNEYKSQLPEDWHTWFVGGDYQSAPNIESGKHVYQVKGFHSSRGTFCYAISNLGANLINDLFKKINDPPDWYFNYVIDELKLNNFWAEPPLVKHNYSFPSTRYYDFSKLKK